MNQDDFLEYLKKPVLYPPDFKDWVSDWFATNVPKIPVSQIHGFKLHSVHAAADVATTETCSITAYGDLSTVGPTLDRLANGFYVVIFGAYGFSSSVAADGAMSFSVDGAAASSANEAPFGGTETAFSAGRVVLLDLSVGNQVHSLVAKYKVASAANPVDFSFRWLHALKVVTDTS